MKKKAKSPKRRLGYGWFIAAVIFLANPCINIVDILPDFFGYMLLLNGLTKWADLYLGMRNAVETVSRLRWIMLIKLLCVVFVPIGNDTDVLLLTFAFAIIELMYVLPAINKIFKGLDYFATRFDGKKLLLGVNGVRSATYVFFVGKAFFSLLPELCALSSFEYSGLVTAGPQVNFADFKNLFIIANLFFTSLLGILWLVNIIPYLRRVSRDTPFLNAVLDSYDKEIATNENLFIRRNTHALIVAVIAGLAFMPNFSIDGLNIIPNILIPFFILVACAYLRRFKRKPTLLTALSAVSIPIIGGSYALCAAFELIHGIDTIRHRPDAFEAHAFYAITQFVSVVEYLLIGICLFLLCRELAGVLVPIATPKKSTDKRIIALDEAYIKGVKRKLTACTASVVAVTVLNAAYILLKAEIWESFWLIPFIASIICAVAVGSTLLALYEKIEYKYM